MMENTTEINGLVYDELTALGVIEYNEDLREIFSDEVSIPFSVLYQLQIENKLSEPTRELIKKLFDKVISTRKEFIDRYTFLLRSPQILDDIQQKPVVEVSVPTEVVEVVKPTKKAKKEGALPRRYGKEKLMIDIEKNGGKPTDIQRAMLSSNNLKNLYVGINNRMIKDYLGDTEKVSDEDYRKIISAIKTIEQIIKPIIKKYE